MSVLAEWVGRIHRVAQRDESMPLLASAFGLVILVLGFGLHGVLVAHKADLVPLFERPLLERERDRVARILDEEGVRGVLSAQQVLVASADRERLLRRLAAPESTGDQTGDAGLSLADAGIASENDACAEARAGMPVAPRAARGGGTVVPVRDGTARDAAWTIYDMTCDDSGASGRTRRRPTQDGHQTGR